MHFKAGLLFRKLVGNELFTVMSVEVMGIASVLVPACIIVGIFQVRISNLCTLPLL